MSTRNHARPGSYGRKVSSPLTKPSRPATLTKRTQSASSSSRPTSTSGPQAESSEDDDEGTEDMASFLQFCATCEKQIVTPTITVLYCSEACRRRDSTKSIPSNVHYSPPLSPSMTYHDYPHTTIVPRRSPTILRPLSTTFSELSLYELNSERKSIDLDESTFGMPTESRPYLKRTSTSEYSTPSLVHSPASSYGTTTSAIDNARPLPRKHSCTTHRGIDLVTPIMGLTSAEPRRKSAPADARSRRHA